MESSATKGVHAYLINLTGEYKIGAGNSGDVYKIFSKDRQKVYACKFLKKSPEDMSSSERLGFERELEIIKNLDSPFIIKYYDNFIY